MVKNQPTNKQTYKQTSRQETEVNSVNTLSIDLGFEVLQQSKPYDEHLSRDLSHQNPCFNGMIKGKAIIFEIPAPKTNQMKFKFGHI